MHRDSRSPSKPRIVDTTESEDGRKRKISDHLLQHVFGVWDREEDINNWGFCFLVHLVTGTDGLEGS